MIIAIVVYITVTIAGIKFATMIHLMKLVRSILVISFSRTAVNLVKFMSEILDWARSCAWGHHQHRPHPDPHPQQDHHHHHLKMLDLQVLGGLRGEQGDVSQLLHLDLVLQVLDVVACDVRIKNPSENESCKYFLSLVSLVHP